MASFRQNEEMIIQITGTSVQIWFRRSSQPIYASRRPFRSSSDEWKKSLLEHVVEARQAVARAGLRNASALVMYQSPTLACQVSSLGIVNRSHAERAARLACRVATHHAQEETVESAVVLGVELQTDRPKSHLLAASDCVDVLETVCAFVEQCGLRLHAIIPTEAVSTAHVIRSALSSSEPVCGQLYLGEHFSCMTVASAGQLLLFKQLGLTTRQLIEALTGPMIINSDTGESIQLARVQAADLLMRIGVPRGDQSVDEDLGIRGMHMLAGIQSHLQRAAVEIKQSLRFGLPEELRYMVTLNLVGGSAFIPRLAEVLETMSDVRIVVDPQPLLLTDLQVLREQMRWPESHASVRSNQKVTPKRLLDRTDLSVSSALNLLPPSRLSRNFERQYRHGLWVGMAASLLIMIADGIWLRNQAMSARLQLESYKIQQSEHIEAIGLRDEVLQKNQAIRQLDAMIHAYGEDRFDWGAVCRELAEVLPESIRLSSIATAREQTEGRDEPMLRVTGFDLGDDDSRAIRRLVDAMRASPLSMEVEIGDVEPGELYGQKMRRFVLTWRPSPSIAPPVGSDEALRTADAEAQLEDR